MAAFRLKSFFVITLLTSIWINASEVFRYFVFIRPSVQNHFEDSNGIGSIDWGILAIWGLWDTLLTAVVVLSYWLFAGRMGTTNQTVLLSGSFAWASVFVIFWVANANMGLSSWHTLLIALPLSWIEMIVGTWLAAKLYQRFEHATI